MDLEIRFLPPGGEPFGPVTTVSAGEPIEASAVNLPGPLRLQVNDVLCSGDFQLESDRLTQVVLRLDETGCVAVATSIGPLPSG